MGIRGRQFLVGVRGFEPPASWSQTMRASHCATPRHWGIYHSGEGKSKVSCLSSTLIETTIDSPQTVTLNHLTLTRAVRSGGSGDTPDPGPPLADCTVFRHSRGGGNPVRETPLNPLAPTLGVYRKRRGASPLFTPLRMTRANQSLLAMAGNCQTPPATSPLSILLHGLSILSLRPYVNCPVVQPFPHVL